MPTTDAKPDEHPRPATGIRAYEEKDLKTVRMMVGTSVMEGLARANKQTYFHPLILTLYLTVSLLLDYRLGWVPRHDIWWSPIALLTGFGAAALPLLGIVEFINRDYFETLLRLRLGSKDLVSISDYYGDDLSLLEFRGEVIGLVAVDYQRPGETLESVIPGAKAENNTGLNLGWLTGKGKKGGKDSVKAVASMGTSTATATISEKDSTLKKRKSAAIIPADSSASSFSAKANHLKGTTGHIRHLYVDAQYRGQGLEWELIRHALSRAFGPERPAIHRVIIASSSYASPTLINLLKEMTFVQVASGDDAVVPGISTPGHEEREGIMVPDLREFSVAGRKIVAWSGQWWEITREQWQEWLKRSS
ncbi:hypothetical protein QFC19_003573 [Naganishia cerealis]|uniref:Uncharacterized protein n=1 Tax=Naganishia cerealis TaxID=610337 RepID=A0ACC2W2J5_9TREE|nr:hypothetical protein QFC19_003573 [Naganishia cerealis]